MNPQTRDLYQILLDAPEPLTARQLARKLRIVPNAVYRLADSLLAMGLITQTGRYSVVFSAKPIEDGLSLFLMHQNNWFRQEFSQQKGAQEQVQFSFIQSREELMNRAAEEISKTKKTVDLLRSGHEVTSEVMLSIVGARRRNVRIRMLIQDYSIENAHQVNNWKQNGIEVRKISLHQIRLMIFDSHVAYFMSYKHSDSGKDMGMKIEYAPFATILSQLFEQWWNQAEKI